MATNFEHASRTILKNGDVSYCYAESGPFAHVQKRIVIQKDGTIYAQDFVAHRWGWKSRDNGGWIAGKLAEVQAYLNAPEPIFSDADRAELAKATWTE